MPQPPDYTRLQSFTDYQTANPSDPLPGDKVDGEYNRIKQTLDQVLTNLALIQRDDGNLANESVGIDQIASSVTLGLNGVSVWASGTDYAVNDAVFYQGKLYRCVTAHTSTTFSTDLSSGNWEELVDYTDTGGVTAPAIGSGDALKVLRVKSDETGYEIGVALGSAAVLDTGTAAGELPTNGDLGNMSLQAASSVAITGGSISGITDLAVADGGTGASTASAARGNLGLGTAAVEADTRYNHRSNNLSDVASASTARGNLGLGTAAVEDIDDLPATVLANTVALSGDISPSQITADQNDYNPTGLSGASTLRLSTDASRTITGLAGGSDGRVLLLHNVGSDDLVLADESGSSTAANRFALGKDITLGADRSILLRYDATSSRWRVMAGLIGDAFADSLLHVQDQKASGTDGGSSSSGDNDRDLNTIVTDEIGITGVTSPKIEGLPAGTYYIEATSPAVKSDTARLRLYDVTAGADLLLGLNSYASDGQAGHTHAPCRGRFTLSQQSDLKAILYCATAVATNGLGFAVSNGNTEIYTDVRIWKVG